MSHFTLIRGNISTEYGITSLYFPYMLLNLLAKIPTNPYLGRLVPPT